MLHSRQIHQQLIRNRQHNIIHGKAYYPLALRTQCIRVNSSYGTWLWHTDVQALSAHDAAYDAASERVNRLLIQL